MCSQVKAMAHILNAKAMANAHIFNASSSTSPSSLHPPSINMEKGRKTATLLSAWSANGGDAHLICERLREEEIDSRGVGGGVMICGPAGRRTTTAASFCKCFDG